VRALRRIGFEVIRQKGSHVRLSLLSRNVTVPLHPALLPKTLASILKQAQISIEQLQENL
jgi:predicted RNA binding protein YcfA (HicA-like mRNA interferase family)